MGIEKMDRNQIVQEISGQLDHSGFNYAFQASFEFNPFLTP